MTPRNVRGVGIGAGCSACLSNSHNHRRSRLPGLQPGAILHRISLVRGMPSGADSAGGGLADGGVVQRDAALLVCPRGQDHLRRRIMSVAHDFLLGVVAKRAEARYRSLVRRAMAGVYYYGSVFARAHSGERKMACGAENNKPCRIRA